MQIDYVTVSDFTPNLGRWTSVGTIAQARIAGAVATLPLDGGRRIQVSFLSDRSFRLRFDPNPLRITRRTTRRPLSACRPGRRRSPFCTTTPTLVVETAAMRVEIDKQPYCLRVYRGAQLVCADTPDYNLVYIPVRT